MNHADRERRLMIFEADHGRSGGWYVEHRGRRVARLVDWRFEEMFWDSYRVVPLGDDPVDVDGLLADPGGWSGPDFAYRSREFGEVAWNAFPSGRPSPDSDRVLVRGLYLDIGRPSPWERCLLWSRGRRRGLEAQ